MQDRFSFDELCVLADLPSRTVRYYIQRGLVDRPVGETRAAYYTRSHLDQLLTVRKWTGAGLSLERVGELMHGEADEPPLPRKRPGDVSVWSRLHVAEGIEIAIEPGLAALTPEQVRAFAREVMTAFRAIREADKK